MWPVKHEMKKTVKVREESLENEVRKQEKTRNGKQKKIMAENY